MSPLDPIPFDDAPLDIEPTSEAPPVEETPQATSEPTPVPPMRTTHFSGEGACRVKTFHAKLRADSLDYLDVQINEWLAKNPECEVKFATTSIGPLSGKTIEDAIFVNLWL